MGSFSSTDFKDTHILHSTKVGENKLHIYLPTRDKYYTFSIFNKDQKFRFFSQESISLPSGSIYLIGGQTASYEEDPYIIDGINNPSNLYPTNFVAKISLKKQNNFQIDISKMKICKPLPEPRTSHLMIYQEPYIFVIGGYLERNVPTKTCLKFHTKKKIWESISDITFAQQLIEPCGIAIKGFLYVFDTAGKANLPRIHRYSIELNLWIEVLIQQKNKMISIPPSLSCSIYQTKEDEVIIFSGSNLPGSPRGYYYTYNVISEELGEIVTDDSLEQTKKEKQGNQNYIDSQVIYSGLKDRKVKMFRKLEKKWMELELTPENVIVSDFGCCSRKR